MSAAATFGGDCAPVVEDEASPRLGAASAHVAAANARRPAPPAAEPLPLAYVESDRPPHKPLRKSASEAVMPFANVKSRVAAIIHSPRPPPRSLRKTEVGGGSVDEAAHSPPPAVPTRPAGARALVSPAMSSDSIDPARRVSIAPEFLSPRQRRSPVRRANILERNRQNIRRIEDAMAVTPRLRFERPLSLQRAFRRTSLAEELVEARLEQLDRIGIGIALPKSAPTPAGGGADAAGKSPGTISAPATATAAAAGSGLSSGSPSTAVSFVSRSGDDRFAGSVSVSAPKAAVPAEASADPAADDNPALARHRSVRERRLAAAAVEKQRDDEKRKQKDDVIEEIERREREHLVSIERCAAWRVAMTVVRAFLVMDANSTAKLREERLRQRQRALTTLAFRVPHLFKMWRRRRRLRRLGLAVMCALAAVRFRSLLRAVMARRVRRFLRVIKKDPVVRLKAYLRTMYTVKRHAVAKFTVRRARAKLMQRQSKALELYLMLTRPHLVMSARELAKHPLARPVRELPATALSPAEHRPCFVAYPAGLDALVAPHVPYWEMLAAWKRRHRGSRAVGANGLPVEFEALAVEKKARGRVVAERLAHLQRARARVIRVVVDHHFSERRLGLDMLHIARRARLTEARLRVIEDFPQVKIGGAIGRALIEIEAANAASNPFNAALLESSKQVLAKRLPRVPYLRTLPPPAEAAVAVTSLLKQSKLLRLLTTTGTEIPVGFAEALGA